MNRFASSQLAFYSPLCVIQDSSLAFQCQSRFLLTPWDQVGRCGTNIAGTNCVIRSIHSFIAKDSHKRKLCKNFSEGRGSHSRHRLRPRTISIPRVCKRQTQRANIEADSVEDYFCWAVFLPFMDFFHLRTQPEVQLPKSFSASRAQHEHRRTSGAGRGRALESHRPIIRDISWSVLLRIEEIVPNCYGQPQANFLSKTRRRCSFLALKRDSPV